MINFFRKKRQGHMDEKNDKPRMASGKYLKYAIGEIVLVVIGILIAIQLNEWRLESSNNKQKQTVLNALKVEFETNLAQMDTTLFYTGKVLTIYPIVNELIKNADKNTPRNVLSNALVNLSFQYTFNPSNGALRSAISSSEIHLLDKARLIEMLFSWEDVVKDAEEEAVRMRNFQYDTKSERGKHVRVAHTYEGYYPELEESNDSSNYLGLFQDPDFEDYTSLTYIFAYEYIRELNTIKNQNKEILALISEELKGQ